jgi:hypothetical protein
MARISDCKTRGASSLNLNSESVSTMKDRRVVSNFSQNVFGGQRTKRYNDVAINKSDVDPDVWLEVTPQQPLTPGEYAIVFMPKDPLANPDAVYDFNVDSDPPKPQK